MRKVFISYARQDKPDVEQLVEHLRVLGSDPWTDSSLHGGQDWWEEILQRIADCDAFIPIISHAALNSTACRREFDWSEALSKPVLPVAIETLPKALPRRFSIRQIVDYSDPSSRDRAALRLAGGLANLPLASRLPDPLPERPAAPLSYLTDLIDLVSRSETLNQGQQRDILNQLDSAVRSIDQEERQAGRLIMDMLSSRNDLDAAVDRTIIQLRSLTDQVTPAGNKTLPVSDIDSGEPIMLPLTIDSGGVNSVAFSPDGKRIVSAGLDKTVRVWDASTGQQIDNPFTGHTASVRSAAFSPDGSRIVSAGSDNTVLVWDASTGQQIGKPLTGHNALGDYRRTGVGVNSVAFSSQGNRIVSGGDDATVRIWDASTGQQIGEPLTGHIMYVNSVAFSPQGNRIVSGGIDGTVRVWDVSTGQQIGEPITGHSHGGGVVSTVAFSPDGNRIVSAGSDKTVRIWDASTGQQIGKTLTGHTGWVESVAFSPDGNRIVSAGRDKTVRIWDASTGQQIDKPITGHSHGGGVVSTVAFSPDGKRIAFDDLRSGIWVWPASA